MSDVIIPPFSKAVPRGWRNRLAQEEMKNGDILYLARCRDIQNWEVVCGLHGYSTEGYIGPTLLFEACYTPKKDVKCSKKP